MISGCTAMPSRCTARGRLEDRARLHLGDLRIDDAEAAAAEAEHGVELVQRLDARAHALDRDAELRRPTPADPASSCGRNSCSGGSMVRMVTGRPAMARKMPTKSVALQRQQLGQRGAPRLDRLGEDHLAHRLDLALAEEHVLGAAQPDALGAEGDRRVAPDRADRRWRARRAARALSAQSMSCAYCW